MKNPETPMFIHFHEKHEKSLLSKLNGVCMAPALLGESLAALERCRTSIIEVLKATEEMQRRRELRVLYEGLSIVNELIRQDDSVPAVRGF